MDQSLNEFVDLVAFGRCHAVLLPQNQSTRPRCSLLAARFFRQVEPSLVRLGFLSRVSQIASVRRGDGCIALRRRAVPFFLHE